MTHVLPAPRTLDAGAIDALAAQLAAVAAEERFFHRLLDQLCEASKQIVTDKLAGYAAAKERIPALSKTEYRSTLGSRFESWREVAGVCPSWSEGTVHAISCVPGSGERGLT